MKKITRNKKSVCWPPSIIPGKFSGPSHTCFAKICYIFIILIITVANFCPATALAQQQILNQSFELIDPCEPRVKHPLNWLTENSVEVTDNFLPKYSYNLFQYWDSQYTESGLDPFDPNSLVVLDTINGAPNYASISQVVYFDANDMLHGKYFFGTSDYLPWNDYAYIKIEPNGFQGEPNYVLQVDVEQVGDYYHTDGWQSFKYLFDEHTQGQYNLICYVGDYGDTQYETYFILDDLGICKNGSLADINLDCKVDLEDFLSFADQWGCDFSDPENLPDPNECPYKMIGQEVIFNLPADINKDSVVDCNDLSVLSKDWLKGTQTIPPQD